MPATAVIRSLESPVFLNKISPPPPPQTFGQMLKAARKRHRMTQDQLAVAAKQRGVSVTQGYVSLIERTAGTAAEPEVGRDIVMAFADALHLDNGIALKAAGHNPDSPLHRLRESDERLRMRIQTEFEVVLPDGSTTPLRLTDLTPEMRRRLADMLVSGELDEAPAENN